MKTITFRLLSALLLALLSLSRQSAPPTYAANSTVKSLSSSLAITSLPGVRFVHIVTSNSIILPHETCIDHPLLNSNPNAIVLVTQNWNPGGVGGIYNSNEIGVWYDGSKWCVFNQNTSNNMPVGAAFNIFIPDAGSHVFTHTATAANTIGHITTIDHPLLNGNPNAIVLVTQNWNPGGAGGTFNNHPIGVYYDGSKWAIFNQDLANMPTNAGFNVVVANPASTAFVHKATSGNISGHITIIDHPLLNNNPNAIVLVTQNWNPGGVGGIYNNHPIGVYYSSGTWRIFNQDGAPMPTNASFNVLVPDAHTDIFVHKATSGNIPTGFPHTTLIDHPLLNNNPNAIILVTQNWNPGGEGGIYNNNAIGVWYNGLQWSIFNQSTSNMPVGASFNVLIPPPGANVFVHKATSGNISGHITIIDHPLLNSNPNAIVLVTQNLNPGGVGGIYNNHPIGVYYSSGTWRIFNQDGAPMPTNASFNVMVLNDLTALPWSKAAFVHTATGDNISYNWTTLNHPLANGIPSAFVFATDNFNPGGTATGVYNNHHTGVWYDDSTNRWAIFNQDNAAMPTNASFNVLVIVRQIFLPLVIK